jgi:hypothetical protein
VKPRNLPWVLALAAAAAWTVAHVVVHAPRGWPMNVLGEWDLLLTALAIASGYAPDAAIGTLHGPELGSWLVAALVAVPIRLGVDPVTAGKWVAVAFGASSAGVIAWFATWLGRESRTAGIAAGGLAGLLVALAWPGLHFELQGVNGRTPESLLFQLLAVVLVATAAESVRLRSVVLRGGFVGASLCLGWLMSPVALWTTAVVVPVLLWQFLPSSGSPRRGLVAVFAAALGFLAPLALFGVLVPGGGEGLRLFLLDQFGGGMGVNAVGVERLGFGVLGAVSRALEGGAHNPALSLRPIALALFGWGVVLGAAGTLVQAARGRQYRDPAAVASLVALSWLVPLALLPQDIWFYPLAYRYWLLVLGLGFAVLPALLATRARWGRLACGGLALLALLITPTLPRSIIAPAASRAEALVSSGAHRLGPRPGRDRHAAFSALFPQLSVADAVLLAEGYGLALGGDMAVLLIDGSPTEPPWVTVPPLPGSVRQALLVGVGCGLTAVGAVPVKLGELLTEAPAVDRPALFYGLGRCAVDPGRRPMPSAFHAIDASRGSIAGPSWLALGAGLRHSGQPSDALGLDAAHPELTRGWRDPSLPGLRSSVRDPAQLMPPRWIP